MMTIWKTLNWRGTNSSATMQSWQEKYFARNVYETLRLECKAANERKQAQEQLKIEQASKGIDIGTRAYSPTDDIAKSLLLQAIEKRSEKIRSIIEEAKENMHIVDEAELERYQDRIKYLWNCVEKNMDELSYKYGVTFISIEADELPVEVTEIVRMIKKQKETNFKKAEEKWELPKMELQKFSADPNFNKPSRIDVVIGADLYPKIMKAGIIKADGLLGQATTLGWIVSGNIERSRSKETFVVAIPFKKEKELGESRKTAVARLISMEKKFDAREDLKDDYKKFMREYQEMGHMKEVEKIGQGKYYLPHQAVIKKESTATKLRVVFDASAKTTNGYSLNDVMLIGPRLQKDIVDIIVKWRMWRYVMSADVEKMYRQIKVREEDQEYQYIIWRENPQEKIKEFKLTTVTYGTVAAPFLAVRTVHEIGNIYCKDNKNVHDVIKNDFYMDDLMTGGHTIQDCKELREKLMQTLQCAGFHLRKWLSNNPEIIDEYTQVANEIIQIEETDSVKTLGLQWEPKRDLFKFKAATQLIEKITKRTILSQLAKIFDPLGWLAPVTIVGRCFKQKLWSAGGSWDEPLNKELEEEWLKFAKQLDALDEITIPRWIGTNSNTKLELHAFGDASDKAYAAVIYAKVGQQVTLLLAKSKVNPIKNRKTIPKLELCSAHLLAIILNRVKKTLNLQCKMYAWSDSMVTLAWIQNKNNKEKFIRTRVNYINEMIPEAEWKYVKSS
ncbi:uncharacterized protein LOC128923482 [Zeugodacus cucurbitae]|uniref:uncharacterized protein LOC128923482 n=1 Tax=Zeugodacus cucurbitae TaxID=28588 RepID=UPI0023D92A27|nr:uncharacterized protein LOC128923482 [Zeugodacus cucurbitae]